MRDLKASEKCDLYDLGECPFCHGKIFFEGPHGGASVNWYCANAECGAGFNLTPEPFRVAQLIHPPKADFEPNWSAAEGVLPTPLQVKNWPDKKFVAKAQEEDDSPTVIGALDDHFGQPHYGHSAMSEYEMCLACVPDQIETPDIQALARGTVSGQFVEWPNMKRQAGQVLAELGALRAWAKGAVSALERAERDRKAACDFIVEASGGNIGCGDEPIRFLVASHQELGRRLRGREITEEEVKYWAERHEEAFERLRKKT